jgi:hypothetical protein
MNQETAVTATTDTTRLLEALELYFLGEKLEALVFILPLGLLLLVFGAWLLTDNPGGFARGVAIPLVVMGLLMGTVGAVVGYRTPGQVSALATALRTAPATAVNSETARMAKVNDAWKYYLAIWALGGVAGLTLRFATRGDFTQGLGIALVLCAGIGLAVDGFAERRARPYTAALEASNRAE